MGWLTPNAEGDTVYRLLAIPGGFLPQVDGALMELENVWNWEDFGILTPQESAAIMSAMVALYLEGNFMIAMEFNYHGDTIPDNCLLCDGATYQRVDYPDLYSRLAAAYIIDEDTFAVPNRIDNFALGSTTNDNETGGEASHVLTLAESAPHDHEVDSWGNNVVNGYLGEVPALVPSESTVTTSSVGGGEAHNNMPPYLKCKPVIIAR